MEMRKFKALISEKGRDDYGVASGTFEVYQLVKDKVYIQADERFYDKALYKRKPFFVDDNGCSRNISTLLKECKIVEIFD